MNLFTSKKYYSDNGVCSFHEFARELDEDYLRTQVNGGDCGGGAPSGTGGSGGSGSGGGTGHGTGGSSSSGATTTPQAPAVNPGAGETQNPGNQSNPGYTGGGGNYEPPKEVMSNPQAYAYWLSLQDKAMKEGDPGKYKDYNVLGNGSVPIKTLRSFKEQKAFNEKDEHCDIYAWNEAVKQGKDPRGQNREAPDLNQIKVDTFLKAFPNERTNKPIEGTQGYVFFDWEKDGKYDHMEYYMAGNGNVIRMKTDGKLTPEPKLYSIDDTKYGSIDADIIFVPLPNRWERY